MSLSEEIKEYTPQPLEEVADIWPWTWSGIARMVVVFAVLTGVFTAAGLAVVEWFAPTSLGQSEEDLSIELEEARTPTWNTLADLASIPSDTFVKIGLIAVLALVLPPVFKRWHDWTFLVSVLLLEVSVYGLSSYLVGRPRPPVERLSSAPTESFPSGHMAAAVAFYFGVALVISWHNDSTLVRAIAYGFAVVVSVGMFLSRLYLGMHYVSDLIAGIILGALAIFATHRLLEQSLAEKRRAADDTWPEQARSLDP